MTENFKKKFFFWLFRTFFTKEFYNGVRLRGHLLRRQIPKIILRIVCPRFGLKISNFRATVRDGWKTGRATNLEQDRTGDNFLRKNWTGSPVFSPVLLHCTPILDKDKFCWFELFPILEISGIFDIFLYTEYTKTETKIQIRKFPILISFCSKF